MKITATTEIKLKINKSILLSLKEEKDTFVKNMLFNNALVLFRQGKLSLGKAAELAGYSKLNFIAKLQSMDESIFSYTKEEIDEMLNASDELSVLLKK